LTYLGNPNGAKQLWSKWTFKVYEIGRHCPRSEVEINAARWIYKGFGSAGRIRALQHSVGWEIECLIEGPPAHDPGFVESVRQQFQRDFVSKGWNALSWSSVKVRVMAGDVEDGKPRAQMIEMPFMLGG
jgi:hypothetical protein